MCSVSVFEKNGGTKLNLDYQEYVILWLVGALLQLQSGVLHFLPRLTGAPIYTLTGCAVVCDCLQLGGL